MKNFLSMIVLTLAVFGNIFGQNKKVITSGIVNGKATYLPKPEYSQEAKGFCASGQVQIEVLIGENGNVIEAKAISGDELLHASAVEAAKKAKFSQTLDTLPVKIRGIVVYNFVLEEKCINSGVVNKKAIHLPKPYYPFGKNASGLVKVFISIDVEGKVVAAKSVSGHPLLRPFAETAARQTKFPPILVDERVKFYVRAILLYNFKSDHTVETNFSNDIIGKAINLAKPPFPSCCKFGKKNTVIVQAEIDEQGNVISSKAISGHPLLRQVSEQAARASKFSGTKISDVSVKAKLLLAYEFLPDDGSVNVVVKSIQAIE